MKSSHRDRGWQQYVILLSVFVAIALLSAVALWVAGAITQDQSTGAEPSSVYHEALSKGFPLQGRISWREPNVELEREPTAATLDRVEHDWAAIWFTIDGIRSGRPVANPELLLDRSLIERLEEHRPPIARQTVDQTSHTLQVNYYSIDGAVMRLHVTDALARYEFNDSVNDYPLTFSQSSEYSAVVVLTDGRWRLAALDRVGPATGADGASR